MNTFEIGKIITKRNIEGNLWVFSVGDVFHLSREEYVKNEAFNDTLGDYEPDKELPTNSVATIIASNSDGDEVELKWCPGIKGVYPHIRKKGWSKMLFVNLNAELKKWKFPDA